MIVLFLTIYHLNFNPRSYKRSDPSAYHTKNTIAFISIHAPTRGATGVTTSQEMLESISIHAPTRGATRKLLTNHPMYQISIHAPTRGATS